MRRPFVLLTGFAPFGARRRNESAAAVRAVGRASRGRDLRVRILPVSWGRAFPTLCDDLRDPALRAVVLCGEAARRKDLSVEARGRNRCASVPDEDGRRPRAARLAATGPAARPSTWSASAIVAALCKARRRAVVSHDAGTYLCNAILFRVLGDAAVRRRRIPVTFVHLPIPGHGARDGTTPAALAAAIGVVVAEARRRFLDGAGVVPPARGARPAGTSSRPRRPRESSTPAAPRARRAATPVRRARAPRRGSRRG